MAATRRAWALGALAALLSFAFSWVPSYWADEVATVRAAMLTPAALAAFTSTRVDAGHALYYLVIHCWSSVLGFSEPATRGFSAIGVGMATALLALIGRRLGRPRLGLLAAALLAFMPRMTWAGAEARSYAWTAALAAAAWLLLLIALERGRWWRWLALGAVAAVAVAAFLLTATLLLAQLVYVLVRRRRAVVPLLLAWAGALAVASPVLLLAWRERAQIAWIGPNHAFTPWTVLVEPWGETSWGYGLAVWLVLAAGAVCWRGVLRRACPEWLLLAGCWAIVPFAVTVAVSLAGSPVFTSRYLTFAMPGVAMLLAAALAGLGARAGGAPRGAFRAHGSLGGRRLTAAVAIALLLIAVPTYVAQRLPYAKPRQSDLREVARMVQRHSNPGDAFVFAPGRSREAVEAYPGYFAGRVDIALKTPFPASGTFHDKTVPLAKRTAKLAGIHAVIVVARGHGAACSDPSDAQTLFQQGFAPVGRYPTHREVVCRFVRLPRGS